MKRGFVALCVLVSMMVVGCQLSGNSEYESTQYYVFSPSVTIHDTTYIDETVGDIEALIDTVLLNALSDEDLAGIAAFSASGISSYDVDSSIKLQVKEFFAEMLPDVQDFDFQTLLEDEVDYFSGRATIYFNATQYSTGTEYINSTIGTYTWVNQQ